MPRPPKTSDLERTFKFLKSKTKINLEELINKNMEKTTAELIAELTKGVNRLADGQAVKTAAATSPALGPDGQPLVIEKGITDRDQQEAFVDPLRKTFEGMAKMAPGEFAALGATKTLDNPYGYLRAKNADGSYVISTAQLEQIILGAKAFNDGDGSHAAKVANGAMTIGDWMSKSGEPNAIHNGLYNEVQKGAFGQSNAIMKSALDSTGGAALIRTDLEPMLHEIFLRVFPGLDAIPKIPSNGLLHSFVQQTAPGSASFVSEVGSLSATESTGTYGVATSTNIAVMASQRTVGLKMQYASRQSGMNFNLGGSANTEVTSALRAIAKIAQTAIFQGNQNVSNNTGTLDDETGLYNANSLTGLRQTLTSGSYSITKSSSESYLNVLRRAIGQLLNAGADLQSVIMFLSVGAQNAIDGELEQFYTVPKGTENAGPQTTNFGAAGLRMLQNVIANSKLVPAGAQSDGIGYYTLSSVVQEDIYMMDPEGVKIPYLGSPTPVVLELPLGSNNILGNQYIPFWMAGLAVYAPAFNRKIRILRQTV